MSKSGRALISCLPPGKKNAVDVQWLAKRSKISDATAYRIISTLSQWENIHTVKVGDDTMGPPTLLYYIDTHTYTISINPNRISIKVGRN